MQKLLYIFGPAVASLLIILILSAVFYWPPVLFYVALLLTTRATYDAFKMLRGVQDRLRWKIACFLSFPAALLPVVIGGLVYSGLILAYPSGAVATPGVLRAFGLGAWRYAIPALLAVYLMRSAMVGEKERIVVGWLANPGAISSHFVRDAARLLSAALVPVVVFFIAFGIAVAADQTHWVAWIVGAVAAFASYSILAKMFFLQTDHVRGQQLWTAQDAARNVEAHWKAYERNEEKPASREHGFFWGGFLLPPSLAARNFCFVGEVGSGKSTLMTILMQSVLHRVGAGWDHRALLYNPAREAYSQLRTVNTVSTVLNMNPFDARCHPWSIAADVTSPSASLAVSSTLIPDRKETNPFFTNATRLLMSAVMDVLHIKAPGAWTFADVCRIMRDKDSIRSTLEQTPATRHVLSNIEVQETLGNVMTTIWSYMKPYDIIAALWETSTRDPISLREWMEDETGSIMLIARNHKAPEAGDALNRVIFRRLSQILQDQEPSRRRRTWFFLDEVTQVKYDDLADLATNGRKYGGCIALGLQDMSRMYSVYGKDDALAILGQMKFKTLLRCDNPENQEWCAKVIGDEELREESETTSQEGKTSTTRSNKVKPVVMPSEFATLPVADPLFEVGITGWYSSPVTGPFGQELRGEFFKKMLEPKTDEEPEFVPRAESEEYLRTEWTEDDVVRLHGFDLGYFWRERTEERPHQNPLPDLDPDQDFPGFSP